ncbi:MAG: NADH:flavin oxidoreductase [Alphaproteobacteria bacterium]|nr:MAG: NADH:flavin oxidoreductase [Alphaproteobacteria bacterium]
MARDPRYDILFEPVQLGPVTARNRFYQVPHCNGMGHAMPEAHAAMRAVKAEGGWAVVSTEECEIHPSGDISPYVEARLWDDQDIPALQLMCDKVHAHGSLAAVELVHNGVSASNLYSREIILGPSHQPSKHGYPHQARAMDLEDIRAFRRWHRDAALRARRAGFDIVYVYAGHDLCLPMHFLQKRRNHRTDAYGGSLENRVRLLREMIEDTRDAVGDRCAVAVRFAVDELIGDGGVTLAEAQDVVGMLADLPDLWDVNVAAWANDSMTSRFAGEGAQEPFIAWVKKFTAKPVVGVGRFTSPDTMVSQIRRGILDMIGAARPSIADPFLPRKIEEGRLDDIRECIGCNICVTGDMTITPIRCTQNPTMGEEWRKGWHPERLPARAGAGKVLVVGAGPAGLEAARVLGVRGYEVHLAETSRTLGGRVERECRLPGLAEWGRVRDWRVGQLDKLPNVSIYRESPLTADDVLEFGAGHVLVATGSHWRRDGFGRATGCVIAAGSANLLTPDDIMDGITPAGHVVIYDDDGFYMAGVMAERLVALGCTVTLVTPEDIMAGWTAKTLEYGHLQKRLHALGVRQLTSRALLAWDGGTARFSHVWSGDETALAADALMPVTMRLPNDGLYQALKARPDAWTAAGVQDVRVIGDAEAPGLIAHATYAGYRYGIEMDAGQRPEVPFRRHLPLAQA